MVISVHLTEPFSPKLRKAFTMLELRNFMVSFLYIMSKRKVIFQNLEGTVKDLNTMKDIMRYNGYKK